MVCQWCLSSLSVCRSAWSVSALSVLDVVNVVVCQSGLLVLCWWCVIGLLSAVNWRSVCGKRRRGRQPAHGQDETLVSMCSVSSSHVHTHEESGTNSAWLLPFPEQVPATRYNHAAVPSVHTADPGSIPADRPAFCC